MVSMLSEDVYHLGSRPLELPRKALGVLRESGVSGLKDATLDLGLEYIGLERVHAGIGLAMDGVARTREYLQRLSPEMGSGEVGQTTLGILPISSACTLGVSLLDRTEAIFDRWLTLTAGSAEGVEGGDSESEDSAPRVPRPIPGGMVMRMLSWRVSRTAVVHFTLLGFQESCNAAMQCLASSDVLKMLARRLRPEHLDNSTSSRNALATRAGRLAHQGCERILGDTATMRLLEVVGRLLGRWLGTLVGSDGKGFRDEDGQHLGLRILDAESPIEASDGTHLQVPATVEEPAVQADSEVMALELVSGPRSETPGERFTLVVKNSFIEVLEEPASPMVNIRRSRSLDGIAGTTGTTEVFTLVVNCLGPAARGHQAPHSGAQDPGIETAAPAPAAPAQPRSPPPAPPPSPAAATTSAPAPAALAPAGPASTAPAASALMAVGSALPNESEADAANVTVLLKGIPSSFTTLSMLQLLDEQGFATAYTFVYVPVDFARGSGLGYAVISLAAHADALRLMRAFDGFQQWAVADESVCMVSWNEPHQGLDALIERYRNSPVMHPSVAEAHRPAVFAGGRRVVFPPPTRTVRAPRVRHVRPQESSTPH